jgi:hypothetical protein
MGDLVREFKGKQLFKDYFHGAAKYSVVAWVKIAYLRDNMRKLLVLDWVKFIGITGSVAAGTVKEEDDIDVIIVVKNHRLWLYRLLVWLRNFGNGLIGRQSLLHPYSGQAAKNKICMSLMVEERALEFEHDLFVLHEIMYMIPEYKHNYKFVIMKANDWMASEFGVAGNVFGSKDMTGEDDSMKARWRPGSYLLRFIDFLSFLGQLAFMLLHRPDLKRIWRNKQIGRIEFFSKEFKKEKLANVAN